jgi:hypothetical protein
MTRIRSSIALVAGVVGALGLGGAAFAADMGLPVKAPPPPAPPPLDIHGFVEMDYESFLINPQGQALINHGAVTTLAGLEWGLYHNKTGFFNSFKVGGLVAADWSDNFPGYWGLFEPSANGDLFDTVMAITASVTFGQYWTLSEEFFNVYSGDVACRATTTNGGVNGACNGGGGAVVNNGANGSLTTGFGFLNFNQLSLTFNDSFTGWPISFNPYVRWYYEFSGNNSVQMPACFSCQEGGSDFFIGATPTWNAKYWGAPWLTFKVPTYVTVGSASFWTNGGPGIPGTCCGVASSGGLGVFTIGLTAVASLTWIPSNYGAWYIKGGFQYYDVINSALIASNQVSICGAVTVPDTCGNNNIKDIFVGFVGLGVGF